MWAREQVENQTCELHKMRWTWTQEKLMATVMQTIRGRIEARHSLMHSSS